MTDSRTNPSRPLKNTERTIRAAHLINSLEPGGAETFLYRMASGMDRGSFQSSVVSLTTVGLIGERLREAGIPVTACEMPLSNFTLTAFKKMVAALRQERPDVLMTWMGQSDLLGLVACRMARIPHLIWNIRNSAVHKRDIGARNAAMKKVGAKLSRFPDAVIYNSEVGMKAYREIGYRPRREGIISNGYDLNFFRRDQESRKAFRAGLGIPESTQVVGFIANFRPVKNHAMFFEAAKLFVKARPDVQFVLGGRAVETTNEQIREMAGPLISDERFHYLGELSDVPRVLNAVDVQTVCSLNEGFPNAVGEAMAMGVPCVVTDSAGDAPRIVGDMGRVVPLNDGAAMALAWGDLLGRSEDDFDRMRYAVRQRIADHFSLEAVTATYESLLKEVVG